jgi:hypothetical protein
MFKRPAEFTILKVVTVNGLVNFGLDTNECSIKCTYVYGSKTFIMYMCRYYFYNRYGVFTYTQTSKNICLAGSIFVVQ